VAPESHSAYAKNPVYGRPSFITDPMKQISKPVKTRFFLRHFSHILLIRTTRREVPRIPRFRFRCLIFNPGGKPESYCRLPGGPIIPHEEGCVTFSQDQIKPLTHSLKYCKQKSASQLIIKPEFEPRKTKYLNDLTIQKGLQERRVAELLPIKGIQVHLSVILTPS
jgi:hypothetical protein